MRYPPILVTGASGKTGSRIAMLLESCGAQPQRVGRHSHPGCDWSKPESFGPSLASREPVDFSYEPDYTIPGTEATLYAFRVAASDSGLRKLVMVTGRGESHAHRAEQTMRRSSIPTTELHSACRGVPDPALLTSHGALQ